MSNIVIFVGDKVADASVLVKIQRVTGRGLSDIRNAIQHGTPIFEREIFDANYEEHASTIRAVIGCLEDASVPSRIYEIPEGETMKSCSFADKCQISAEVLRSILDQADVELGRQMGE